MDFQMMTYQILVGLLLGPPKPIGDFESAESE